MTIEQTQALSRTFIFFGLLVLATILASTLASALSFVFFDEILAMAPGMSISGSSASWWQLHFQNFVSQSVGFGGAAWLAWRLWRPGVPEGLWGAPSGRKVGVLTLAILATVLSSPLMSASYEFNASLIPEGGALEAMFLPLEKMLEELTTFIASAEGMKRVVVVLSVAALPAFFEELAFRGVLQPLLIRCTGNAWVGILMASIIFSAIHFQFYGFLPRMLLGMLFGWLAYRSGSLVPGMAAHFVNNSLAAITLWYTGSMTDDFMEITWPFVVASAVLTGLVAWGFDRTVRRFDPPATA
jgi:uncharacterized protein